MRLFKSKLRRRIEKQIDKLREELISLEYQKTVLHIRTPSDKQKDLIDQIRLLKSILQ